MTQHYKFFISYFFSTQEGGFSGFANTFVSLASPRISEEDIKMVGAEIKKQDIEKDERLKGITDYSVIVLSIYGLELVQYAR